MKIFIIALLATALFVLLSISGLVSMPTEWAFFPLVGWLALESLFVIEAAVIELRAGK